MGERGSYVFSQKPLFSPIFSPKSSPKWRNKIFVGLEENIWAPTKIHLLFFPNQTTLSLFYLLFYFKDARMVSERLAFQKWNNRKAKLALKRPLPVTFLIRPSKLKTKWREYSWVWGLCMYFWVKDVIFIVKNVIFNLFDIE